MSEKIYEKQVAREYWLAILYRFCGSIWEPKYDENRDDFYIEVIK